MGCLNYYAPQSCVVVARCLTLVSRNIQQVLSDPPFIIHYESQSLFIITPINVSA